MSVGTVQRVDWCGVEAWALESDVLRTVMIPALGAKIVSLFDRRGGCEWLASPMPGRTLKPVDDVAPFVEQDMSGWDEMFPTINACAYPGAGPRHGVVLPDHGEVWRLPWTVTRADGGELVMVVEGRALPYRLSRSASLVAADTLAMRYELENLADDPLPYLWSAHPQFLAGSDCQITLPGEVTEVVNTISAEWGWGEVEDVFAWPEAIAPDGRVVRLDRVGGADLHLARKFFARPDARPTWTALRRGDTGHGLCLTWDPAVVPYLGLWIDQGAIHCEAIAAPEPGTGWYDSLATAWGKGEVTVVPPHGLHTWMLSVRLDPPTAGSAG